MNKQIKEKAVGGYVTVYLSLILGLIIILVVTVIEGARKQTIRFETECVMDAALNSIFAEYHRELRNRYGMLFIDDSYGKSGSVDNTKDHFLQYMNMNFNNERSEGAHINLTALHADNATPSAVSFACDDKGTVLRYQIIQYMKSKSGIKLISHDDFDPISAGDEETFNNYAAQRKALDEQIEEMVEEYNMNISKEEDPVDVSNPADAVEIEPDNGILYYAFGEKPLSSKSQPLQEYISSRGYVEGCGLSDNQKDPYGAAEKTMFVTYLFNKLGYEGCIREGAALDYQLEYLLEGKSADIDNLEAVVRKIFVTRYVVNMAYLYSDSQKKSEAMILATVATTAIGMPELAEAVSQSILLAWGYAESAQDLRILFDGHKLSPVKTGEDWNISLVELVDFKAALGNYHAPANGTLDYKGFLLGFLFLENDRELNMRLMDIMEMDIRLTPGNQAFRMDNQIYSLSMKVNVSSRFGYGCSIQRYYSYR